MLKRFNDDGRPAQDLPLVQWACEDNMYKAQVALDEMLDNFPNRIVGSVLGKLLFPWGRTLRKASDQLDHQVSRIMQTPCEACSRLGTNLYLTLEPNNQIGLIEKALTDILAAEPIFDKVVHAANVNACHSSAYTKWLALGLELGVITEAEAEKLRVAEQGRLHTINVDDFDPLDLAADKSLFDKKPKPKSVAA